MADDEPTRAPLGGPPEEGGLARLDASDLRPRQPLWNLPPRHERSDSHRQLEGITRSSCLKNYTPHAIIVGTTFCLLLASAMLLLTRPPANAAGQRALLIERIMQPPKIEDIQDAEDKARAIDLLAGEQAAEAILPLIDCLSDTRALNGSDNWVRGHAANALEAITGQHFGTDIEK